MKPCLSEALTMSSAFADDVAAFASADCHAMEVWLTKLEAHVEKNSIAATKEMLTEKGMALVAGAYHGGLLLSQGQQRREHYADFERRLSLCQEMGIPSLLIVADFVDQIDAVALDRAQVSLKQAAQLAGSYGVRLGLEFRGKARWCASLDTAAAMVMACAEPNVGLVFDVFHYYVGPSKFEDLRWLTKDNLVHVQLCDLAGTSRELASDSDRILPGDGDFELKPIMDHFRAIGYDGYVSVELFNPDLWQMKSTQVAEAAMTSLQRLL